MTTQSKTERQLGDAVCLLWDIYNDDKNGRRASQILELMEDLDWECWHEEVCATAEYQETDAAQMGAL